MQKILPTLVLIIVFTAGPARAQGDLGYVPRGLHDYNFLAGPQYRAQAEELYKRHPDPFDYTKLRSNYALTQQYDPLGDHTNDQLLRLAYYISIEKDAAVLAEKIAAYRALLIDHLGNLGAVTQAMSLARQDKRLGEPAFLKKVRAGLLKSVMVSGNGGTLSGAYHVLTMAEETALLAALRVNVVKTLSQKEGIISYNMHDYIDTKTGKEGTVFVNVTRPLEVIEDQMRDTEHLYIIKKR